LAAGEACVDYSFVTGESVPVTLNAGSWVYAGGRQLGSSVRVLAQKTVSQSYLVSLWNQQQKDGGESSQLESNYIQKASQYFTMGLFTLATFAAIYWAYTDSSKIWNAVTAVLLVACPCALLLSVTFTHGHFLSLLAKNGFYLKGPKSLDTMNTIKQIVFDKTGTLTQSKNPSIVYEGQKLTSDELDLVAAIANESIHPHARQISKFLDRAKLGVTEAVNYPGQGILGKIGNHKVELGSKEFLEIENQLKVTEKGSFIGVKIDGKYKGYFILKSAFRPKLMPLMQELESQFKLTVLSGDNDSEKPLLKGVFPNNTNMIFNQKPLDKRDFVAALESADCATMMVGDGLNDAGALMSSSFGLAITDDVSYFSPGSDAILLGDQLPQLGAFFKMSQKMRKIIWWSFAISIAYNVVGLFFAVRAELNPMIAAILMPASSITIVLFTWIASTTSAKILKLKI
jgi:Cu+-exporting ATPase